MRKQKRQREVDWCPHPARTTTSTELTPLKTRLSVVKSFIRASALKAPKFFTSHSSPLCCGLTQPSRHTAHTRCKVILHVDKSEDLNVLS